MVDQLRSFAGEVTRVAREVGTEGRLGGQAQVPEVAGTWKDLTDSVNSMAGNLTAQVRNIAEVSTAIANGDLSRKITVDVRGEILQLKETLNTMVDQLNRFASEVTRVAREVGTEGKLGRPGQRARRGGNVEGSDRERQFHGIEPHRPGAQHRRGDHGRGARRFVAQDHGRRQGRNPRAQEHHQHHGRPAERLRRRGDARGARGRHGRQARRPGAGAGRRGHLGGSHRQRQLDGVEPDRSGAQYRGSRHRDRHRRPVAQDHGRRARRDSAPEGNAEHHGGPAALVRRRGDARGARGRHRRPLGRAGRGSRRGRHLEGPDRQREPFGGESHHAGAQHRRSHHGGRARRFVAQDHGRRQGRNPRAQEHHQHHGRPAERLRRRSDARGARGRHRRAARRPGAGARRRGHLEGPHRHRQRHGGQLDRTGARHRQGRDRGRERRSEAESHRRLQGRGRRIGGDHQQHDGNAGDVRRSGDDGGARGGRRRAASAARPTCRARREPGRT